MYYSYYFKMLLASFRLCLGRVLEYRNEKANYRSLHPLFCAKLCLRIFVGAIRYEIETHH